MLIHWTLSVLAPKSFCIDGIATLTMLVSRTDMNTPAISTTSGSPQPLAAGGVGAVVGGALGGWGGGGRRWFGAVETPSLAVSAGPPEARVRDSDSVEVSAWLAGNSSMRPRVGQQTVSMQ
ncbi:MAG TPA: hypothetical protein VK735_47175 [Pseudonocardia sp.]|nr:hypothetical protein [Pseudonocardia sp.]